MNKRNIIPEKERAFTDAFNRLFDALCNYTMKFVRDREVAEDIVVGAFSKLWERFEETINYSPLLYTICKHTALNHQRSAQTKKVTHGVIDKFMEIEDILYVDHYSITLLWVKNATQKLSKQQRLVLTLCLDNKCTKEISKIMKISERTVLSTKTIGINKLKKMVKPDL